MADGNRFPPWFLSPSAGRGRFAVRAAVGIASVCGRSPAESATDDSSVQPLGHDLDRQSRSFDGSSPLV